MALPAIFRRPFAALSASHAKRAAAPTSATPQSINPSSANIFHAVKPGCNAAKPRPCRSMGGR